MSLNNKPIDVEKFKGHINRLMGDLEKLSSSYKENMKVRTRMFRALTLFFKKAEKFEKDANNNLSIKRVKKAFRNSIYPFLQKSILMKHGYIKPRGYPGDSFIIESIYDNVPKSNGFGRLLDEFLLKDLYSQAIRNRKDEMKSILKEFISEHPKKEIKILNLACGSCREIRELISEGYDLGSKIEFNLVDKDKATLNFAKNKLKKLGSFAVFKFFQSDVLSYMLNFHHKNSKYQKYDLIYSIGLADYLPNSYLGYLIQNSCLSLKREGKLIIAHKNIRVVSAPAPDWMCDWKFIPRDISEVKDLVKRNLRKSEFEIKHFYAKEKTIVYFVITRV